MSRCVIILLFFFILVSPSHALDFKWVSAGDGITYLEAKGEINTGDKNAIAKLFSQRRNGDNIYVSFNSIGGDLFEGIEIGRYIRSMNANTIILNGNVCYSSCFFSFIGGIKRTVEPKGKLGVHQFYGGKGTSGYVESTTQYLTSQLLQYTAHMGVSIETLKYAFQTPPRSMYVFTPEEINQYSIAVSQREDVTFPSQQIWRKNGWTLLFDVKDRTCQMSKMGKTTTLFMDIIQRYKTKPYIAFYADKLPIRISPDRTGAYPNLSLIFDDEAIFKYASKNYETDNRSLISVNLRYNAYNEMISKKTMRLAVGDQIIEEFDLTGAAEADHQLGICFALINY